MMSHRWTKEITDIKNKFKTVHTLDTNGEVVLKYLGWTQLLSGSLGGTTSLWFSVRFEMKTLSQARA